MPDKDGNTKATDCPGTNLSVAEVRRLATKALVAAGQPAPTEPRTASELLVELPAK